MVVTMSALPGRPPASGVDEFVGRDRELDDLRPLLQRHRLVTLTGPAGVGKTRLAVELIPLVRRSYRGLWWVELAPLPAGSIVTAAVATALGREEPGRDLADTVHESGRSLLLCGAREQPSQLMKQAEFERHVSAENICGSITEALERAAEIHRSQDAGKTAEEFLPSRC